MWPEQLPRVYRVLDTLLKALEERGYAVAIKRPAERWSMPTTFVRILGQDIAFHIEERGRQVRTTRTYGTGHSAWSRDELQLEPSGELAFKIDSWSRGARESWRDGSRQRLELVLSEVIAGLVAVAELHVEWEREREAEAKARAEAEQRRQEHERLRRLEESRAMHLTELVQSWQLSREMRGFLAELKSRVATGPEAEVDEKLGRWIAWAERYTEDSDPLNGLNGTGISAFVASLPEVTDVTSRSISTS